MNALEVIGRALFGTGAANFDRTGPAEVLSALRKAGYAVVELKAANKQGKWSIHAPNDMYIEDGDVVRVLPQSSGGTLSFLRPSAARAFAGALLAAADAAEASDA